MSAPYTSTPRITTPDRSALTNRAPRRSASTNSAPFSSSDWEKGCHGFLLVEASARLMLVSPEGHAGGYQSLDDDKCDVGLAVGKQHGSRGQCATLPETSSTSRRTASRRKARLRRVGDRLGRTSPRRRGQVILPLRTLVLTRRRAVHRRKRLRACVARARSHGGRDPRDGCSREDLQPRGRRGRTARSSRTMHPSSPWRRHP
jgi:hypothetical protein